MPSDQIRLLLETAGNQYNEGDYEQSMATWGRVLELDPDNQKAKEGIRMARLLARQHSRQQTVSHERPPSAEVRERVRAGIARVRELAAAGDFDRALKGCSLLEEIKPDDPQVRVLREAIQKAAGGATTVETADLDTGEPEPALVGEPIPIDDMVEPSAAQPAPPAEDGAAELIPEAEAAEAPEERGPEELFSRAVEARDAGRLEEALDLFQQVRAKAPTHAEALMNIEEINARLAGEAQPIGLDLQAAREVEREKEESAAMEGAQLDDVPLPEELPGERAEDIGHDAGEPGPAAGGRIEGSEAGRDRKPIMLAAAGALAVVGIAVGAYFWFSDSGGMAQAEATVRRKPITVPARPAGPQRTSPQQTTARHGKPSPSAAGPATSKPGHELPEDPAERRKLAGRYARQGRDHLAKKEWAAAAVALREAHRLDPQAEDIEESLFDAMQHLEEQARQEEQMAQAAQYFQEGDYASSLHKLYRLQQNQRDRGKRKSIENSIRNAWYDWGVVLMNAGAINEAVKKFNEALEIDPADQVAARARKMALRYVGKSRDEAFNRFVESLPTRAFSDD
ncbi:MAG: tetratricopeptide repeat protein [Acidobacteriota bacterium]